MKYFYTDNCKGPTIDLKVLSQQNLSSVIGYAFNNTNRLFGPCLFSFHSEDNLWRKTPLITRTLIKKEKSLWPTLVYYKQNKENGACDFETAQNQSLEFNYSLTNTQQTIQTLLLIQEAFINTLKIYPHTSNISEKISHIAQRIIVCKVRADSDNRALVLEFVKQYGKALQFASDNLKNDEKIVRAALEQDDETLQFASINLKSSKNFILSLMKTHPRAFISASDALKKEYKALFEIIRRISDDKQRVIACDVLADPDNKALVLKSVKQYGKTLQLASDNLKDDKEIVFAALNQLNLLPNGSQISSFSTTQNLFLTAMQQNYQILRFAPNHIKDIPALQIIDKILADEIRAAALEAFIHPEDEALALQAVTIHDNLIAVLSDTLKENKRIVFTCFMSKRYLPENARLSDFETTEDMLLFAIKEWVGPFLYMSDRIQNNKEIILSLMNNNGHVLECIPERFKEDEEVVLAAMRQAKEILQYASKKLQKNNALLTIDKIGHDDGRSLACNVYANPNNRALVLNVVKQYGPALQFAANELKEDKEILFEALKNQRFFSKNENLSSFKTIYDILLAANKKSHKTRSKCDRRWKEQVSDYMLFSLDLQWELYCYAYDLQKDLEKEPLDFTQEDRTTLIDWWKSVLDTQAHPEYIQRLKTDIPQIIDSSTSENYHKVRELLTYALTPASVQPEEQLATPHVGRLFSRGSIRPPTTQPQNDLKKY